MLILSIFINELYKETYVVIKYYSEIKKINEKSL